MEGLNQKIFKMKSTLNKMKSELSTIQQSRISNDNFCFKKYHTSSSMQNIFSKGNSLLEKSQQILHKTIQNSTPKKANNHSKYRNSFETNISYSNNPPLPKKLNRANSCSHNHIRQRNKTKNIHHTFQDETYLNYKDIEILTHYSRAQSQSKKNKINLTNSQNSTVVNTNASSKNCYNKNIFRKGLDYDNCYSNYTINNSNNNNMYLDFQKGTVLNHNKINENGWKSSKYKYKYDKFGDLNTCCVNNGSINLNHSNSVNKQLTYANNNMKHTCNTIVKTLCAIFDNESNANKLIQKIKRGNDVSNEINPYLIEMETMYNNKYHKNKNVDYESMKKWVKNKTKKIEYFKKELELYKQLYQMLQSLSPLTLSDVEDDYYDSNSSYYNIKSNNDNDTNILDHTKEREYDIIGATNKIFQKRKDNNDEINFNNNQNDCYNINY